MKKIIFILLAAFGFAFASQAQAPISLRSQYSLTVDTVTSTAAKYLYSPIIRPGYKTISVSFHATEISGTTAGTATLEASNDGTHWYSYFAGKDSTYSYTLTDVAEQAYRWTISNWEDIKFRIKVVGVSTPSVKIYGEYVAK